MRVGALVELFEDTDIDAKFKELTDMEMHSCQVVCWNRRIINDASKARAVNEALAKYDITATAFWCGWDGPRIWNFYEGQETLGLVPEAYRGMRIDMLKEGSDFAKELHVADFVTHVGFMPENPHDPRYFATLAAVKNVVDKCGENGQYFLFETGQETPITLLRSIQDLKSDHVGINLDPANLILYGKGNPIDALDTIGSYVRGVHGKDGFYPTDGHELGKEVPLGEGKVNYPAFIKKLKEIGYQGDITIEREITGTEQKRDILAAKKLLDELIAQ